MLIVDFESKDQRSRADKGSFCHVKVANAYVSYMLCCYLS
jgi:hypothetical protein